MYIPQKMKLILFFFSLLHRTGCRFKNWLYDKKIFRPKKAALPVISVGNITFGGSGKTPLVMSLMAFAFKKGIKPALITRGYRGRWEKRGGILSDGKSLLGSWQDSGDEAFMVALNIPQAGVFTGKNRLLSCGRAVEAGFELAVLDDGFQHRRLCRDLDIVLLQPSERAFLREPVSSLKRADIILMEKEENTKAKDRIKKAFPRADLFYYSIESQGFMRIGRRGEESFKSFRGKRAVAFCGIARPERFLALLQEEGVDPVDFIPFPDHYPYSVQTLERISRRFHELGADVLITTEKDAVKIIHSDALQDIPAYYLKIDIELEKKFHSRFYSLLQKVVSS